MGVHIAGKRLLILIGCVGSMLSIACIGNCPRVDVTYFVHPDTPLDKEAAERSTSTYLVDRRLDMVLFSQHDFKEMIAYKDNYSSFSYPGT